MTKQIGRFVVLLLTLVSALSLPAQSPYRRAPGVVGDAAVAESIAVMASLEQRVRASRNDAEAWHRLGIVAWTLWERAGSPGATSALDATRLGRLADTALRIAADLRRNMVEYRLDLGRFLMAGGTGTTRLAAQAQFARALESARTSRDQSLLADAALELGKTHWRRYDVLANRRLSVMPAGSIARSISEAMTPLARSADALEEQDRLQRLVDASLGSTSLRGAARIGSMDASRMLAGSAPPRAMADAAATSLSGVREMIENSTRSLPEDANGVADLSQATALFLEAHGAAPNRPGVFRVAAMALADRYRWAELQHLAQRHLATGRSHGLAWLALGLAAHRQHNTPLARAAFDTAQMVLAASDRQRLDDWFRVLSQGAAARVAGHGTAAKAQQAQLFWELADPLWSDDANYRRIEFWARVTFAELRWTIEELDLHGVDTDRGDVYVRYGQPDIIAVIGPEGSADGPAANVTTFWIYNSGLMFAFTGLPTFATAYTPRDDIDLAATMKNALPVEWRDVLTPALDSIPVQVARFRAGADSVDVVVAAEFAPEKVRQSLDVAGTPVVGGFWLVTPQLAHLRHVTGVLDSSQAKRWVTRVSPSAYLFRTEVFAAGALRAAQSTGVVDAGDSFVRSGFGLSDVLLGTGTITATAPRRWRDAAVTPSGGIFAQGAQLTLVWECYGLTGASGANSYDVAVTFDPVESRGDGFIARVVGSLAAIARVDRQRPGTLTFAYARNAPVAEVAVEQLDVMLSDAPAGAYIVTVEVVDRASGARASRSARFTVIEHAARNQRR